MRRIVMILSVLVGALAAAGCGGSSSKSTELSAGGCTKTDPPAAREPGSREQPAEQLELSVTYRLVFTTNCGAFTVTLDQKSAPATAASLVALAKDGYFDDTIFHRIVPDFVIQGGDPTQQGSGGPGYSTVDPPASDAAYVKGVVAMAKSQDEAPGTAGSQFFVVTGADVGLPPEYAIVGKVTDGIAIVDRIAVLGDANEQPTEPVVLEKVAVENDG